MFIKNIPFEAVDWTKVKSERHNGESGYADWKVKQYGDIRVRVVEYSPNYRADHWCSKGHIIYCLEGEMITELKDGRLIEMRKGMSYHVEEDSSPHRSYTKNGATLFIVD